MLSPLDLDINCLSGVGERRATLLKKELRISCVRDLLFYFPYKHIDRTRLYKVSELHEEMPYVQLQGVIEGFWYEGEKYKKRLKARFVDDTGEVELVWFNQINYFFSAYKPGVRYVVFGKPVRYGSSFSIVHPEVEEVNRGNSSVGLLYPVYSVTDRMRKGRLTSKDISDLVRQILVQYSGAISEVLPEYVVAHYGMLSRAEALQNAHFPRNSDYLRRAMLRLKMEELFYLRLKKQILLSRRKQETESFRFVEWGRGYEELYEKYLGFHLTGAQERVLHEINSDLLSGQQMNRLLQGDVGSGKTIIALLSMLRAVGNGFQACIMAPTEILASQHFTTIKELLAHQPYVRVSLLVGSMGAKKKREVVEALLAGEIDILVGTHILIEDYVSFARLGLVVIDEQHRFGVSQRAKLWDKSNSKVPHVLIMSATPIPRTLAMTIYGDLDVSVIDELPPGRSPVQTWHAFDSQRTAVYGFILDQVNEGRQVYVVYPLIEESEKIDLESLEEGFEDMQLAFPAFKVGMVHGRMKAEDKESAMARFVAGELNILVATTVIEVGVNVPNASVMLINHAERFGLSQLHQLRGRVGRGAFQSYCILMTSDSIGEVSQRRIAVMCRSTDGFYIAEQDMQLRGHGDMEGTIQSGVGTGLKLADLSQDGRVVQFVSNLVAHILSEDPTLVLDKNALLRFYVDKLIEEEKDWGMIS